MDPLRRTVEAAESATTVCTPDTSRNLAVTSRTQLRQPMPPTYKVISLIVGRSRRQVVGEGHCRPSGCPATVRVEVRRAAAAGAWSATLARLRPPPGLPSPTA